MIGGTFIFLATVLVLAFGLNLWAKSKMDGSAPVRALILYALSLILTLVSGVLLVIKLAIIPFLWVMFWPALVLTVIASTLWLSPVGKEKKQ
jgi:hypothetical protein